VVEHLTRLGYVDDRTFARQWAAGRVRLSGFGRRRIEQELRQKGVDKDVIHEALKEVILPEDERETARALTLRKLKTMKDVLPETRKRRLAAFLERKGFSYEIIREMIRTPE
jgi:regulatory protein